MSALSHTCGRTQPAKTQRNVRKEEAHEMLGKERSYKKL